MNKKDYENLIINAYKKFKSYIYYDNTMIHTKIKLAEFEAKVIQQDENVLKSRIKNILENYDNFNEYLNLIDIIILPKANKSIKEDYYSNFNDGNQLEIEDINIFIDLPIELHLISVMWIMTIGEFLDSKLSYNVYGYRLYREDNSFQINNYKLFYKYYDKYSEFRDNAVNEALKLHENGHSLTFINLDIKKFFYNIKVNFDNLYENYIKNSKKNIDFDLVKKLNDYLREIHKKFHGKVKKILKKPQKANKYLPIGMLSSHILANYYFKEFDYYVINNLQPYFYGRYVDDMLLVFQRKIQNIKELFEFLSCFKEACKKNCNVEFIFDEKDKNIIIKIKDNEFVLQKTKIKIFYFDKDYSIALLNNFRKTIEKNRSIFLDLPKITSVFNSLEDNAINIMYEGSINKLSSIKDLKLNTLNISINLTFLIKILLLTSPKDGERIDLIKKVNEQIKTIFSGYNVIEMIRYWEKIFIYCFVSDSFTLFQYIWEEIISEIEKLKLNDKLDYKISNYKKHLKDYLYYALSLALATNYDYIKKYKKDELENLINSINEDIFSEDIFQKAKNLEKANLHKQYFNIFPIINYLEKKDEKKIINKYKFDINELKLLDLDIKNTFKIKFSPRFIRYDEILLLKNIKNILYPDSENKFLDEVYIEYIKINKKDNDEKNKYKNEFPKYDKNNFNNIIIFDKCKKNKLKFALANIKIIEKNIENAIKNIPDISIKRLDDYHEILNMARKFKCDFVIFPEVSIPFFWIPEFIDFSRKNQIAIIGGLEHLNIKGKIYNFSFVILPFKDNKNYLNVFIDFNLKKYYSPEEKRVIKCNKFDYIEDSYKEMMFYKYCSTCFSVYNCFELTNLNLRAKSFQKVDFVVAVEYNRDVNYFSNLVTSFARDLHAYVVQVNTSNYGENRIIKPSKTEELNIVTIKGGEDINIVTGTLNIKNLREFQKLEYECQKEEKTYKPTPAGFDRKQC